MTLKHTKVVSLNAYQANPGVHLIDTSQMFFSVIEDKTKCFCFVKLKMHEIYNDVMRCVLFFNFKVRNHFTILCDVNSIIDRNLVKQAISTDCYVVVPMVVALWYHILG